MIGTRRFGPETEVSRLAADRARLARALGGFLWLGHNLHNITADPVRFREFYEAALADAREALREAGLAPEGEG